MKVPSVKDLKKIAGRGVKSAAEDAVAKTGGVLRLAPNWVPRSFMQPGKRLKLAQKDLYALGLDRGGIDERWFASTTEAANFGRQPDEGLSYVVFEGKRFLLRDAIAQLGAGIVGKAIWSKYRRWPVFSKFFDNMGPICHHIHQTNKFAKLVGMDGKPETYYFPPQYNFADDNFPYTFFGLNPDVTKKQVKECMANWNNGDNGILDLSRAYRLQVGTGWYVQPGILHAPGSFCTYEPQWGSDVFGMYQSLVEGRPVDRALLTKDMPKSKWNDLDFIVDTIDWKANVDPDFHKHHFLMPKLCSGSEKRGYFDYWINYGRTDGWQAVTAKRLTVLPGESVAVRDNGAYGLICVQGVGKIAGQFMYSPSLIHFTDLTCDEYFVTEDAAKKGVVFENDSPTEVLEVLRYFGPEVNPDAPELPR